MFVTPQISERSSGGRMNCSGPAGLGGLSRQALTPRELEIVQHLAGGKTSKEVSALLGISVKTIETHRTNIMRKLNFHSVSQLVMYAVRNNLLRLEREP
jgi:DNA-binding CsgD family transcriptional regulator